MIRNYLKIAWRNVIHHKTNSAINISGLALGICCCMFIFLWVQDEKAIDNFHSNGKNLFSVYKTVSANGQTEGDYNTPIEYNKGRTFLLDDITQSVPEVKNKCFFATGYDLPWGHPETLQVGEKVIKFDGARASSSFFEMFSYPLLAGSAKTALRDINSIAISRHVAVIFFGSPARAIGKAIRYENKYNFVINSVFDDVTAQSSLRFDFLLNWELQKGKLEWSSNSFQTFIQLADNTDIKQVESKINRYLQPRIKNLNGVKITIGLQGFGDRYLHNVMQNGKPAGGRIAYVKIFSEVAIFILLIACINFMNLATARSTKRAKEVGVLKAIGSGRVNLIVQFLLESLLYALLATLLAILLMLFCLPAFSHFTGKQFDFPVSNFSFWVSITIITLITGLVAGGYPAIYLSSLKPVAVLKGVLQFGNGTVWFRKGLVIFQFILSTLLVISTIVIIRQTSYVQNKALGYDRADMIYTRIEGRLSTKSGYLQFKARALQMPGIAMVDRTTEVPQAMNFVVDDDQIKWQGKAKNETIGIKPASVGFDFVKLMKLKIMTGRNFNPANATDSASAFLVNQEAVKQMGLQNPIGKWVSAWNKRGYIIGVLKDYHTQSLHEPIKPILLDVKEGEYFGVIIVKTLYGKTAQALKSLETLYKEMNPDYPFSYQFVDQEYAKLYSSELIISKLSAVFAAIAILISCLGLLGLVIFSAELRVKEFGVRKVLGASLSQLLTLFSKEFLQLIIIAFVIAAPIGWYATSLWLAGFAYRINLSWWIFALTGVGILTITLLTVSYQSIKAALATR